MMSKKHYEAIAAAFESALHVCRCGGAGYSDARAALILAAENVADAFGDDNPRFDRRRFLTACGFKQGPA